MIDRYILKDGVPVPEPDLIVWGEWMQSAVRHVALTQLGDSRVSTVFLGLDHSFSPHEDHIPILYETMIFGGPHDGYQDRYATVDEARLGHVKALELLRTPEGVDEGQGEA